MSDRIAQRLERAFGSAWVSQVRARFDGPQLPRLAPTEARGFCEALDLARSEGWCVVPVGFGSKLSWCAPPRRADFLLSTADYAGVVAHEPGDGTLTARAGTTIAELNEHAARGGHAFTPDVPRPQAASLGGVIAAGQSGPDRLRHGPVRDHVLGVEVALTDGTRAKSGGRLVKNVTGYDLHRLYAGSHGSLCVLLEASMRLFPLADEDALVEWVAPDRAELVRRTSAILALPVRWLSLDARRDQERWRIFARLSGRLEVVEDELAAVDSLGPLGVLRGAEARARCAALRDQCFGEPDGPLLRAHVRPSALSKALAALEGLLARSSGALPPRWQVEPGLARIDAALGAAAHSPAELQRILEQARAALAPSDGRVLLLHAPREAGIDPFGPPDAGLAIMGAIRAQLDPAGVLASGRFLPASAPDPVSSR